jgi:hypothetical protein
MRHILQQTPNYSVFAAVTCMSGIPVSHYVSQPRRFDRRHCARPCEKLITGTIRREEFYNNFEHYGGIALICPQKYISPFLPVTNRSFIIFAVVNSKRKCRLLRRNAVLNFKYRRLAGTYIHHQGGKNQRARNVSNN